VLQDNAVLPSKIPSQVVGFLSGFSRIEPKYTDVSSLFSTDVHYEIDYNEAMGQEHTKSALVISDAGCNKLRTGGG
jgi:hypothetical protein